MKSGIKHLNEWLIVVVIIIGVSFGSSFLFGGIMENNLLQVVNPNPGVILIGMEAIAAIDIFSGGAPAEIEINVDTLSVLFSMVLLLIAGPWILYKGYKNHEKTDQSKLMPWYWFVGASLNVAALFSIPVLIISFQVFQNTQSSAEASSNVDLMRQELMDIGFATAEYGIIEGGFNNSFSIDKLNIGNLKFEYSMEEISSDSSVVIASTNLKTKSHSSKVIVKPFSPKIIAFR